MPTGKYTDRVSIVVKKTLKDALTRIAERDGETVSAVGERMLAKGVERDAKNQKR